MRNCERCGNVIQKEQDEMYIQVMNYQGVRLSRSQDALIICQSCVADVVNYYHKKIEPILSVSEEKQGLDPSLKGRK